jgi:monofunctional biosynthetic peptidoglycan transglycosylase
MPVFSLLRRLINALILMLVIAALALAAWVLAGRFVEMPSTLMLWRNLTGAKVERQWIPIETISPHLIRAVITSEDQLFCAHSGVDFEVLRELMKDPDGPARGGSTIAMQTVKNVYLWPQRHYIRKALEVPLALAVDFLWGKRRVMEVYLNVAEWGDGIFGAEAAARHHFRKGADQLTPAEAARLAAALPNPIRRRPGMRSSHANRVMARMRGIEGHTNCLAEAKPR